jgi:gamma-glutamyltranspeptidase/glutathione hydrolase
MRVVVADDSGYAAEAGAEVASRGGNVMDACVAAGFASSVVRSLICGVGGSGFMLVYAGGESVLLDFFDQVPQKPGSRDETRTVDLEYAGKTIPVRVGPSTCAVPGTVAGLAYALQRFGTVDLAEAVAPAVRLAQEGFERDAVADEFVDLLGPILELAGMNPDDYRRGRRVIQPGLGELLRRIGDEGPKAFYQGSVAEEITRTTHLTKEDLADYEVIERQALEFEFGDYTVLTNPSPSQGGERLRRILGALTPQSSNKEIARAIQDAASDGSSTSAHTAHISSMDEAGNAASLTISLGEGCGIQVPGTEVMLNNTLGEPGVAGGNQQPGERLPSFMAPTVVLDGEGRTRMALGSPGSSGSLPPSGRSSSAASCWGGTSKRRLWPRASMPPGSRSTPSPALSTLSTGERRTG